MPPLYIFIKSTSIFYCFCSLGSGKVNFDGFCRIASHFLEEEDAEAMQEELKEAFRLYDREGNGYITTATLREILAALDDKLTSDDLDGIIAEIDTDGSGTVDFDGKWEESFLVTPKGRKSEDIVRFRMKSLTGSWHFNKLSAVCNYGSCH